ncbi:uncharacterized protein M6B38_141300 [Iris pallida]|uniref:Tf2-1-like SH3-like domain-containing protein n=1 Tax=Iris pallida TaxID=29817 RepID=A0AAX6FDF7_IRIPA|nr:uncharacterized protein M6B38_141300 [Iris pallida]
MLRACILDFGGAWDDHLHLVAFSYNNSYHDSIKMAPFEALYGRKCRSPVCWTDVGERQLLGPELVTQTVDIVKTIRSHLQAAQDRQKMWADKHRRILEFQPGDHVFLKISPTKGTIRFGTRGKLSPRYIGPFDILEKVGNVSYRLPLPPTLEGVHNVFHVSQLRRYVSDSSHILDHSEITVGPTLRIEQKPVGILDRREKVLRNRIIPLVRVAWSKDSPGDSTWEKEEDMRKQYPYLFPKSGQ